MKPRIGAPYAVRLLNRFFQAYQPIALRYTPDGGGITLSASCGEQVQLRVTDTGSGIEAEDLPFFFDRFYRADKARGANSGKMGLDLAICKALVTAQSGTIAVESAGKDQGATFTIGFSACTDPGGTSLV